MGWLRSMLAEATTDDCVNWPYARSGRYGRCWYQGKLHTAHRVAFVLAGNPMPPVKLDLRHLCGNGLCVNPRHLKVGTRSENNADMLVHGRVCRGEARPQSKLTESAVIAIRASGERAVVLADRYGVSAGQISAVRARRAWAWLT